MTNQSKSSKFAFALLACFAVLLLCVSPALAQTGTTGALTGTVTDPSGAVIVGAAVTATNIGTGAERSTTTDANGVYKLSFLPPGNYRVKFAAAGFKTAEVSPVTVNVTDTATVNHGLELGAQTEQITVESTAVTIQTENATVGQLVSSKTVTDLPLSSRNYTQIVNLSPGVVVNVASAAALGNGTQDINVNGSGSDQNNYMMDGATITNYGSGGGGQSGNYPGIGVPNPDAIQEFKVQTAQYDAAYGQNPGASVNVVTKGGTNQFHGALWEFNRNDFFNANDFFYKHSEANSRLPNKPPTLKQNQYGGVFGGPIKKDKVFFFGSYQGTRQLNGIGTNGFSTGITNVSLLPFNEPGFKGAAARQDQAGLTVPLNMKPGNALCDASTYRKYLGCAFNGNVGFGTGKAVLQDGSNINQVAINTLQAKQAQATNQYNQGLYVPSMLGYDATGLSCMATVPTTCATATTIVDPVKANEDQFLVNTDYVLSSKHTLTEKYFYSRDPQIQSFVCLGGCYPGAPEDVTYTAQSALLKLTSVLTPNFVNEARISYQREVTDSHDGLSLKACDVGIIPMVNNGSPCPTVSNALPGLQLIPVFGSSGFPGSPYGGFNAGGNFFAADTNYFNTYQYADQISWNHGKHAIRAGLEVQRIQWNWKLIGPGRGDILFWNIADFFTSGSGNGAGIDTPTFVPNGVFLNFTTRLAPSSPNYHALRVNEFAAFTEDDIKLTPKLTLNLGIRWEYDGWPSDATGLFTNFWGSAAQLVNTGSFFLGNQVTNPANSPNTIGTLAGYAVQSNYNRAKNLNLTSPLGATGVYVNTNKTLMHGAPYANFAPRIGLAWQPLGNKLVVRAGYGIFYDRVYGNLLGNNQQADPPYAGSMPAIPSQTLDNPFTAGALGWKARTMWVKTTVPGYGATVITDALGATGLTNNATSDSEFMGTPLIQEYNLGVQYEFAKNWVADVSYVGTHGTHLYDWSRSVNISHLVDCGPASATCNPPADKMNLSMVRPASSFPFNDPNNPAATQALVNTPANIMGRVTYLGLAPSGGATTSTLGDHLYNSLQAQLRHQFSHGLMLQASYTWSKLMTNINSASSGTGISAPGNVLSGGANSNNPLDMRQQYGLAAFGRPQRLVISYSYDLPYKKTQGLSGHILGGWSLNGVTTIQNGQPFTVTDSVGGTLYNGTAGFAGSRANLASPVNCDSMGRCQSGVALATTGATKCRLGIPVAGCSTTTTWINKSAFIPEVPFGGRPNPAWTALTSTGTCSGAVPQFLSCGTGFGNSGVGSIMGPGQHNWDMGVIKNTKVTEGTSIQFRAEFFNMWNHSQFTNPDVNRNNNATTFGQISKTSVPGRVIQFALKFSF